MTARNDAETYFDSRLQFDKKRSVVWESLWDFFFSKLFADADTILELGAGWCDFINRAEVKRRIAVDLWPGVTRAAGAGVEAHVGSALDLSFIESGSVDAIFASNLVEHLSHEEFDQLLTEAFRVLRRNGRIALLQPNFRLAYRRYFDDFTHVTMWSEISLSDFLTSRGWEVLMSKPRFLPLTVKSRFPVSKLLIRAYLASPVKPLAGQMLVVARRGLDNSPISSALTR